MLPALPVQTSVSAGAESSRPVATLVVEEDGTGLGCPDAGEIARRLERKLGAGAVLASEADAPTRASLLFRRRGSVRYARVVTKGARPGSRELSDEGPTCEGLAEAVVLTLALVLDPAAPPELEARPSVARRRTFLELGPFLSHGVFPELSAGAALGLATELGSHWLVRLGAAYWPGQRQELDAGSVIVRLLAGDARVCRTHLLFGAEASADLSVCVLFTAGALAGEASGFRASRSATAPWVTAGLGIRFGGSLIGPLEWSVWADAATPLADESFSVEGLGVVYRPSRILVSEGFYLGIRFF